MTVRRNPCKSTAVNMPATICVCGVRIASRPDHSKRRQLQTAALSTKATTVPTRSMRHFPALDGVRAIAILLVIPHNLNLIVQPSGTIGYFVVSYLDRGWIGVQLFFVLSGFLITGILLDTNETAGYLRSFFVRRALRILPVYYALLLFVFVFLSAANLLPPSLPRSSGTELSYWLFFANWYGPLHAGQGSMTHLWSLSVEEQFYLVWPFVVWRRSAAQLRLLCVGIAVLSLCIRFWMLHVGAPTEAIYQFSISRMDALALGGAAAATMRMPLIVQQIASRSRAIFASALIVLLVGAALTGGYAAANPTTMSLGYTLLALDFAAIILLAACADTGQASGWIRFLGLPGMRSIGKYSYSMYLLHVPLHLLVGLRVMKAFGFDRNTPLIVNVAYLLLGTALSYAAAAATYRLIERPFLRLKKPLAPSQTGNALPG